MRRVSIALALSFLALTACDKKEETAKADAKDTKAETDKPAAEDADGPSADTDEKDEPMNDSKQVVVDHTVKDIEGNDVNLADYRGKAMLIVNTASQCGYTPQYAGLQKLYADYKDQGLVVIGFPSNDFGAQEPGTPEEIASFVDTEYGIEFPMMDKLVVKGENKAALYKDLTENTPEGISGDVPWNFTKFLIDPDGKVVARFEPAVEPGGDELKKAIEKVLPKAG